MKFSSSNFEHFIVFPAGIYLLKVNNRNTRTRCEICSKLTINTPERRHSSVSIVNFEQVNAGWVCCDQPVIIATICIQIYSESSFSLYKHGCQAHCALQKAAIFLKKSQCSRKPITSNLVGAI